MGARVEYVIRLITPEIRRRKLCHIGATVHAGMTSALLVALACSEAFASETAIEPAELRRIAVVDERFQSYNVEMVEVTGGRFWRPYAKPATRLRLAGVS